MVDIVDFKLFPPALPREVPRVDPETGLPSDQALDWEGAQANALGQATSKLNQSVIEIGDASASYQSQIDTLSDDLSSEVTARETLRTEFDSNVATVDTQLTALSDADTAFAGQVVVLTAATDAATAEGRVSYLVQADGSGGTDVVLAQEVKRVAAGTTYKGGEYLIIDSLGNVTKLFDVDNFYVGRFVGGTLADFVKLLDIDAGTGAVTVNRLVVTTSLMAPDAVFETGTKSTPGITPAAAGTPVSLDATGTHNFRQTISMSFDGTIEITTHISYDLIVSATMELYINVDGTNYRIGRTVAGTGGDEYSEGFGQWSVPLTTGSHTIDIFYKYAGVGALVINAGSYSWKIFYKGAA